MRTRDEIRKRLATAARGSLSEWREACEEAASSDLVSETEVASILFWWHPLTWCFGIIAVVVVLLIVLS